jgi:superoxide dismutase, Fe-Mn family
MAFELPALPYDLSALEPHISARTLEFHHGKHHKSYIDTLNKLVQGSPFERASLEEIIRESAGKSDRTAIFNNAGQSWNHNFYWQSLSPSGGGTPKGEIADLIKKDLGGYEGFLEAFKAAGATQFGSGWAWLVVEKGKLAVTKSANADNPLALGQVPLLTMDVWEHAYYLDYQNRRPDHIKAFARHLINWSFANQNLAKA